ncbi:MAG: helix-turn-helix domain-containing protein [Candidatus Limisoma sp.]
MKQLGISKSEFARRIGIRQQHVNKLLESNSIDTDKLASISKAN